MNRKVEGRRAIAARRQGDQIGDVEGGAPPVSALNSQMCAACQCRLTVAGIARSPSPKIPWCACRCGFF